MKIDIAPGKNDHLIQSKKIEIDSVKSIDQVKAMAKTELDTIRRIHKKNDLDANYQSLAIALLIGIQISLHSKSKKQ